MSREDIEEAIEVLEDASAEMLTETGNENYYSEAIAILRQALEKQEPVAWISDSPTKGNGRQLHWTKAEAWRWSSNITPLYTAPPKHDYVIDCPRCGHCCAEREWVGLTDEEIMEPWPFENRIAFARWLESKIKEKNHG